MTVDQTEVETLKLRRVTTSDASRPSFGADTTRGSHLEGIFVPLWVIVTVSYSLIGILQWLPFGWNVSPRIDGWTLLGDVDSGLRPYIFISPDLVTRPFFFWIWIFNHHFDPNNFVLLNLILMTMMIVRGTAMYTLMRQLFPRYRLFAYLSGALLIVFPADSGTYYEGATHVLLSFTLQLIALNMLVWFWRDKRWWQLALALLIECVSVGNYEVGDLLYLAIPLILWWIDTRISRRLVLVALLWWVFPSLSLIVSYVDAYFNAASHHATMLDTSGTPYTQKLMNAIQVQFWSAYESGFTQILNGLFGTSNRQNLFAALGITAIVAIMAIWFHRHTAQELGKVMPNTVGQWALVSLAGFFAMLLGIAVFLPSNQLDSFASYQPVRLFYFSAPGAVLTVTALAFAIDRGLKLRGLFSAALIVVIIACGSMSLMAQHQQWRDITWQQQNLIGQILRQTGHIDSGTLIFVIDRSNGDLLNYFPFNYQLQAAIQLITDNYSITARLCYNNDTDQADTYYCHFSSSNVQVPDIWVDTTTFTFPYSQVIGFVLGANGSLTMLQMIPPELARAKGYSPQARFNVAAGLPPRYYTMLTYPH